MKIILVSIYRLGNETGVAKLTEDLWDELANEHKVLYICLGKEFAYKEVTNNKLLLEIPSEPVGQGYIPQLSPDILVKLESLLDEFKADVINAQNIVFISLLVLDWAIKNNKPFNVTFHSPPAKGIAFMVPRISNYKALDYINVTLTKAYLAEMFKSIKTVITPNIQIKRSVLDICETANIEIIPYGLDLRIFSKQKDIDKNAVYKFVYVGSYNERKNQKYLINVFRFLPENFKLALYGNKATGGHYLSKLETMLEKYKIKNVELNDFITHDELARIYRKCGYFVSASLSEAQSLSVIEALASGTPIIGLHNETIEELVDSNTGLDLPQDINYKTFAHKLEQYVISNKKDYMKISQNCREKVNIFNKEKNIKHLVNVYEKSILQTNIKKNKHKNKNSVFDLFPKEIRNIFDDSKSKNNWVTTMIVLTTILSLIVYPIIFIKNKLKQKMP